VSRRLYVYYRVAAADLNVAAKALRQCQAVLMQADPQLHCELLRRPEVRDDQVTLMEIYTATGGVDNAQQTRIDAALAGLKLPLAGPRHTEVFEDLV
jgi:hypothetical protein